MKESVRVIDGGGNGFRRADVCGFEVKNLVAITRGQIINPQELIKFACADLSKNCIGIVYAVAGEIQNGVVVKSPQIHWLDGFGLFAETVGVSGKKVMVVNDMDGAIIGMAKLMPTLDYFMAMTWSSGIGVRVFRNGEILCQGEGGHIPLDPSPSAPLCDCGLQGCAESILGGESIKRRVIAAMEYIGLQFPYKRPCKVLDECFDKGAGWAWDIYNSVAIGMGTFLATYQTIFRFPVLVWKGGFATNAFPRIVESIRKHMQARLINQNWGRKMAFIQSPRPDIDSLIGAAALFRQMYK